MKEIPLTQGKVALVDDADYEWLSKRKWQAINKNHAGYWYAQGWKNNYPSEMHREIMQAPKGMHVDHINGNGLDNRRCNLRLCTHAENMRNRRKTSTRPTSSRFKGVSFSKRHKSTPWQVTFLGKYRGRYATEEEAAQVWDKLASTEWGEFARLNLP